MFKTGIVWQEKTFLGVEAAQFKVAQQGYARSRSARQ